MGQEQASEQGQIFSGMEVFDAEKHKVGRVVGYDREIGYFETEGTFSGYRYIPFAAVESVGPTGAQLNVTKDVVTNVYKRMPPVQPDVSEEGTLTGAGTVLSGYDRGRIPLDANAIRLVREQIQIGTWVYDLDGLKLGTIEAYDRATGYMRIGKGIMAPRETFLPVTSVAYLDDKGIHLSMGQAEIVNRFSHLPDVAREVFGR
jgi:hypothetical protein